MTRASAKDHLALPEVARRNDSLSSTTPVITRQAGVAAMSRSRMLWGEGAGRGWRG
jgi:hypothetical protein